MLRTSAPLIGALYVSGLKVSEGWLPDGIESNSEAPVFCCLFARVLLVGCLIRCEGAAIQIRVAVAVSQRATSCKPKLSLVCGQAQRRAVFVPWRTSREFYRRDTASATDILPIELFCAKIVSEHARLSQSKQVSKPKPRSM